MLNLISPPALEPVTTVEMKAHLRIDDASEDAVLADYISTARETIERRTGLALITQSWLLTLDCWPQNGIVELPRSPLIAIQSIDLFGADGLPVTLDSQQYQVDIRSFPGRIIVNQGGSLPLSGQSLSGIEIRFDAGYGLTGSSVPASLTHSIKLLTAQFFESRVISALPDAVDATIDGLIAPFRVLRFAL